jgi:hypothetical protein
MSNLWRTALTVLALLPLQAPAQALDNLQSIPVFFTCLAQDQEAANAFLNDAPSAKGVVPEAKQRLDRMVGTSSWAVCARRKQWVSKELCRDVLDAYKVERGVDLRPVMSKYEDEVKRLGPMMDYFDAAFPKGGVERPNAPACPE